jgi:NAD+ synthase
MDLKNEISGWLKNYLVRNNLKCFVVGISGGVDSALTSTLCAMTGLKTIVISLPILQDKSQLERANNHISWLKDNFKNVESNEYDLTETFKSFEKLFDVRNELSLANSRARLRMTALYQVSSTNNGIVVGTGNKVEDFGIGFFTKYGDGGVDISPIADLNKSEVFTMSKELGIINEILIAKPTDGLWEDNRNDEDQIGATYYELEKIMDYHGSIDNLTEREIEVYNIYHKLNKQNKHKIIQIPIFKKNEIHTS